MQHHVSKFDVSVHHQAITHVFKAFHQLNRDFLNHTGVQFIVLYLHQFFQITAVTKVHEDKVSALCFNRSP